jgi:hypothetical protein
MRNIVVSTSVFSAIWAKREDGEESEDQILSRILGTRVANSVCEPEKNPPSNTSNLKRGSGVFESRKGIHFPEGAVIFRQYKRNRYEAIAIDGSWVRSDNGAKFDSLNQLNQSIASGNENVWIGSWKFVGADGKEYPISKFNAV